MDPLQRNPEGNGHMGSPPKRERRAERRSEGNALVVVLRDDDLMRNGISGRLFDISAIGLSLLLPVPLRLGEYVVIKLENPVQRVSAKVRAMVRHVQPPCDGFYRVGCSPLQRLNLRELQAFRASQWTKSRIVSNVSPNLQRMRGN
jgi:hypothetical protein